MKWIPSDIPSIPINSEDVHILETPQQFYNTLLQRSRTAKERIVLSSLYLGDGRLERDLVSAIHETLENNESLKVNVLLDALRGTRGQAQEKSSVCLLRAIATKALVSLYHTPELSGYLKRLLSERTNEIIGLQHMKLYIFDDTVIISGANLSDSYFTNRQDRYIIFENCKLLADFFCDIVHEVSRCAFQLNEDGSLNLHPDCDVHPFLGDSQQYTTMFRERIDQCITTLRRRVSSLPETETDTVIYPVIQMGPFGLHDEFDMLNALFEQKDENMKMTLASGYFNCLDEYTDRIFNRGAYKLDVLTAAPKANGFFGASGMSKYVTSMYSSISTAFLNYSNSSGRNEEVKMYEYNRPGWTFHAKGVWINQGDETATIVGSSNYGYRSVHRDLEAQVVLVSSNDNLKQRLAEERSRLFEFSSLLDSVALRRSDHHVPLLVKVLSRFIKNFF